MRDGVDAEAPPRQAGESPVQWLSGDVLEAAPVAMALVDEDSTIRWANGALGRLTQVAAEDLIGRTLGQLSGTHCVDEIRVPTDGEQEWFLPDGTTRWVGVERTPAAGAAASPVKVDEQLCSIVQIVDLTDIKEIRSELERSNRELTQFAYVASHDLSEPLRVIAGHVDLLARRYQGRLDADADRWIGFAVDGCTRMRQLIDDMLDYSKCGQAEDKHRPVSLGEIVTRAIATTFGHDETSPSPRIQVGSLPVVIGSASELERVFSNLLGNATRFVRPDVASQITVAATRIGDMWLITVADNGIGIPEEHRERVFGLFQRLHRQEDYPGTGIGLAICRKVIELHRGRIWVEDGLDGGSRFCIELPAPFQSPRY